MNHENEQPQKANKFVLIEAGHRHYIAIPMDTFIEMDGDIIHLETEGYGDDAEMSIVSGSVNFKLISDEQMAGLKAKHRLLDKKVESKTAS